MGEKALPSPLELACQNCTPPWLLHHLFLVVNKPTDNSNNQSRKPKPLAHNRLKNEHQRKLSLWDNIDIKVAFNCCWRKLTRWWWIENICGLVCGPTLGTIPYTGWVGGISLPSDVTFSPMPEASDDGGLSCPRKQTISTCASKCGYLGLKGQVFRIENYIKRAIVFFLVESICCCK